MKIVTFLLILLSLILSYSCNKDNKPEPKVITQYITARNGLKIREFPHLTRGKNIAAVPFKEKVTILETDPKIVTIAGIKGNWKKISWRNHEGWAFGAFLSDDLYCTDFLNALKTRKMEGISIYQGNFHIHLLKKNKADIDLFNNGVKGYWRLVRNEVVIYGTYDHFISFNFECSEGGATRDQFNKCIASASRKMKEQYGKIQIPVNVTFTLKPLSNTKVLVTGHGRDSSPIAGRKRYTFYFSQEFSCKM